MKLGTKILAGATLLVSVTANAGTLKWGGQIWTDWTSSFGDPMTRGLTVNRARLKTDYELNQEWNGNITVDAASGTANLVYAMIKRKTEVGTFGFGRLDNSDVTKLDRTIKTKWVGWATLTETFVGSSYEGINYDQNFVNGMLNLTVALLNASDLSNFAYSLGVGASFADQFGVRAFLRADADAADVKTTTFGASATYSSEIINVLAEMVSRSVGDADANLGFGATLSYSLNDTWGVVAAGYTGNTSYKAVTGTTFSAGPTYTPIKGLNTALLLATNSVTGADATNSLRLRVAMEF